MVDIFGTDGNETILGRAFGSSQDHQNLFGLDGDDSIKGHGQTNNLFGGNGNDTLTGINNIGRSDALTGGEGADTFELRGPGSDQSILSENSISVLDFHAYEDNIVFTRFDDSNSFYTDQYGSGSDTTTLIFEEGSDNLVASVHGDSFELSSATHF